MLSAMDGTTARHTRVVLKPTGARLNALFCSWACGMAWPAGESESERAMPRRISLEAQRGNAVKV